MTFVEPKKIKHEDLFSIFFSFPTFYFHGKAIPMKNTEIPNHLTDNFTIQSKHKHTVLLGCVYEQ